LSGKYRIPHTIEEMAADYIAEIRRAQPHGPYCLAGHSFGGRVALEIAQQLTRKGERVSFLGLLDTSRRERVSFLGLLDTFVPDTVEGWPMFSGREILFRVLRFINRMIFLWKYDSWIRQGRAIPYEHRM
jgi:thioesterase domain-containing protein